MQQVLHVTELAAYLSGVLRGDPVLRDTWVQGEVCSVSRSSAGHYYFCLRDPDGDCQLKCVLFRGSAARLVAQPASGASVVLHGSFEFYEKQGTCQIIVDAVFPAGMGLAEMQLQELQRRLEDEGLFAASRKRALPAFPRCVGVVSSDTGAVIHDITTVLRRRYPLTRVVFAPTPVQGEFAARGIALALGALQTWRTPDKNRGVDVIIVARGGGSSADLGTFNDERVVRAIFSSRVPVVSAVGHETDVTLADRAADVRAPTPSAAAELVSPDLVQLEREIVRLRNRAETAVRDRLQTASVQTERAGTSLKRSLEDRVQGARDQLFGAADRLRALSPRATLARGYAIAELGNGAVLSDIAHAHVGLELGVRLQNGRLRSTVTSVQAPMREPREARP